MVLEGELCKGERRVSKSKGLLAIKIDQLYPQGLSRWWLWGKPGRAVQTSSQPEVVAVAAGDAVQELP